MTIKKTSKKRSSIIILIVAILFLLLAAYLVYVFLVKDKKENEITNPTAHNVSKNIPQNYYNNLKIGSKNEIKQLREITNNNVEIKKYGDARYNLAKVDKIANKLYGIYDSEQYDPIWDKGKTWNREHVWPNSKMGVVKHSTNSAVGIDSDLHNLRVVTSNLNSKRSNRYYTNSEGELGKTVGDMFFPGDKHKGDVARILLYMVVKYENLRISDTKSKNSYSSYPSNNDFGMLSILNKWHIEDPVDDFEISRNDKIYQIQKNRNPFIDKPELFEVIWKQLMKKADIKITLEKIKTLSVIYQSISKNIVKERDVIYA